MSVDVKVLLCGADAGRVLGVEWRPQEAGAEGRLHCATGQLGTRISAAEKDGSVKVLAPAIPTPVVVRNNQMRLPQVFLINSRGRLLRRSTRPELIAQLVAQRLGR